VYTPISTELKGQGVTELKGSGTGTFLPKFPAELSDGMRQCFSLVAHLLVV
jgi:hypothetical protein